MGATACFFRTFKPSLSFYQSSSKPGLGKLIRNPIFTFWERWKYLSVARVIVLLLAAIIFWQALSLRKLFGKHSWSVVCWTYQWPCAMEKNLKGLTFRFFGPQILCLCHCSRQYCRPRAPENKMKLAEESQIVVLNADIFFRPGHLWTRKG